MSSTTIHTILALQYVAPARMLGVAEAVVNTAEDGHTQHVTNIRAAEFRDEFGFSVLASVMRDVEPTRILVQVGADESLMDELARWSSDEGALHVETVSPASFNLDAAVKRIHALRVRCKSCGGRFVLETAPQGNKRHMVRALGALLAYIDASFGKPSKNGRRARLTTPSIADLVARGVPAPEAERQQGHQRGARPDDDGSEGGGGGMQIGDVLPLFPRGRMHVDAGALAALGVFESEAHPSKMGLGVPKEGISLQGTFQALCASVLGKQAVRSWLQNPLDDILGIRGRLDAVEFFVTMPHVIDAVTDVLQSTADVLTLVRRLGYVGFETTPRTWIQIVTTLASFLKLKEMLAGLSNVNGDGVHCSADDAGIHRAHPALLATCEADIRAEELESLIETITGVVDLDQDREEGGPRTSSNYGAASTATSSSSGASCIMVADGVLPELDELKATFASLPSLLNAAAASIVRRVPRELVSSPQASGWRVVYIPQMGYMLRAPIPLGEGVLDALGDVRLAFTDADASYYATHETAALSRDLGDVYAQILDAESSVLLQLKERCLSSKHAIELAARAAATVDCLVAFARAARAYGYARPVVVSPSEADGEDFITIRAGRHAVQELRDRIHPIGGEFVPNNTSCGGSLAYGGFEDARIHLITGPNGSGKSVYARQVAIVAFLAHVGSFVPADAAHLTCVDAIFASSPRNVSVPTTSFSAASEASEMTTSAFAQELAHVSRALQFSSRRSIVLLDEFGKGTLASNGAALLCSTIRFLEARREPVARRHNGNDIRSGAPKTFIVTHFSELLSAPLLRLQSAPQHRRHEQQQQQLQQQQYREEDDQAEQRPCLIRHFAMQAVFRHPVQDNGAGLVFLYRLCAQHEDERNANGQQQVPSRDGYRSAVSSGSYAFVAASRAGCSRAIVERAAAVVAVLRGDAAGNEITLRRKDSRLHRTLTRARMSCELLLALGESLTRDAADPHALMRRHEVDLRLTV